MGVYKCTKFQTNPVEIGTSENVLKIDTLTPFIAIFMQGYCIIISKFDENHGYTSFLLVEDHTHTFTELVKY